MTQTTDTTAPAAHSTASASAPYAGIRVLELGTGTACAYAGQLLADRGADVIKAEPPDGDPLRSRRPHAPQESKDFQWLCRSKRSLIVNDDDPAGRQILARLIARVDVVLTTWPEARLAAAGIDWESASLANPRLVYCHDGKFGARGEWADRPANDLVLQAFSGLIATEGKRTEDGAPAPLVSTEITQFPAGVLMAMGVAAALLHRERTGRGQRVDVNGLGVAMAIQGSRSGLNAPDVKTRTAEIDRLKALRANGARWDELLPPEPPPNPVADAGRVMYRSFITRDGAVFLGALSRNLRNKARKALGTDFLHRDGPGFDPKDPAIIERSTRFVPEMVNLFASRTTAEWCKTLESHGVPCGEISFAEDLGDSEQARVNRYVATLTHPQDGEQHQVAPPARFGCYPEPVLRPAPALGQHTSEVLAELDRETRADRN
jgi:crotonobetainyl-CoA:carnitine CoA-transferase CaiB-like acyl-CoA transferase